jgi:hypothetical protein
MRDGQTEEFVKKVFHFFHRRGAENAEVFCTAALPIKKSLCLCVSVVKTSANFVHSLLKCKPGVSFAAFERYS